MKLRKALLLNSRLYVILDKDTIRDKSILGVANRIKKSGVDIIQLRDKQSDRQLIKEQAQRLCNLLLDSPCLFIINDYLDLAQVVDTDGIHLGQGDSSIEIARRLLGKDRLIGVSCHSLKQARDAEKRGADYISIGPIFSTPTKPEYKPVGLDLIKKIKDNIKIPFFAIGGINKDNLSQVLSYGAQRVALCRAIPQVGDIKKMLEETHTNLVGWYAV